MKSLKSLHILQNGIKQEGMIELFKSFVCNPELEELKMNDNSMKGSADVFVEVLDKLQNLKVIDISDLLVGDEFSLKIFTIFKVNYLIYPC
jgi:Ran GTPase-activating protein (RanGAP) involved in mRNA processing and transport